MKKPSGLKCYIVLGVIAALLLGSIWGYNIGKQENFPLDDLLANPSLAEDAALREGLAAENEVIVKYKSDVSEAKKDQVESATQTKEIQKIDGINTTVLQTPEDQSG